jgi:hypothetical protein
MKRKWFRFSLRTLLIVVLLYGTLWTLTATIGVEHTLDRIGQYHKDNQGTVVTRGNGVIHSVFPDSTWVDLYVRANCICPFSIKLYATQGENTEVISTGGCYWFFGFVHIVIADSPRPRK